MSENDKIEYMSEDEEILVDHILDLEEQLSIDPDDNWCGGECIHSECSRLENIVAQYRKLMKQSAILLRTIATEKSLEIDD